MRGRVDFGHWRCNGTVGAASAHLRAVGSCIFLLHLPPFLLLCGAQQNAKPHLLGAPVRLQLKFHPGEVSHYRLTAMAEAKLPGTAAQPASTVYSVRVDLTEEETVIQALPNGGGELAVTTTGGQGVLNGQAFTPATNSKPARVIFDAKGNLIAVKDLPPDRANLPLLSNLFGSGALSMHGVFLPTGPVRIGQTWTKSARINGVTGPTVAMVKATLVKILQVGRFRTARIHAVMTAPIRTLVDSQFQPTLQSQAAVGTLLGVLTMRYDTDLAIAEGKVVRAAGDGQVAVTIQMQNTNVSPSSISHSSTHKHAPAAGAEPQMRMTLKLGTELIP